MNYYKHSFRLPYKIIYFFDILVCQFINFIHKIKRMIQKQMRLKNKPSLHNPKINQYFANNQNASIFESFQFDDSLPFDTFIKKRIQLKEICENIHNKMDKTNISSNKQDEEVKKRLIKFNSLQSSSESACSKSTVLSQSGVFVSTKGAKLQKGYSFDLTKRPRSSINEFKQTKIDQSGIKRCNIMFDFAKQQIKSEKISSSRALINFSTVHRKNSNQRYVARKNKNREQSYISVRKITFHFRQKNTPLEISVAKDKKANRDGPKLRYPERQQFILKGWDYD